jgi:Tol biopolymer transport system component
MKITLLLLCCGAALTAMASQQTATLWTPRALSTDQYESSPTFTPDGRELHFMRSDRRFQNYRLLMSRCEKGTWSTPVPPSFAVQAPVLEGDPFVTPDGKRLYFISSRHANAQGRGNDDLDIWMAERTADGTWGTPVRLPEPVNSAASELMPREDAQGRLWFGSARTGGLGGMDIWRATRGKGGQWAVENLGAPINSTHSEYEADISQDGRTLILVADRGDRSHLYRFALEDGKWTEKQRIPARGDVFQVGPLLSPKADRLLFAQADGANGGERSGEMFLIDLADKVDGSWPPTCGK